MNSKSGSQTEKSKQPKVSIQNIKEFWDKHSLNRTELTELMTVYAHFDDKDMEAVYALFEEEWFSFCSLYDTAFIQYIQIENNSIAGLFAGFLMMMELSTGGDDEGEDDHPSESINPCDIVDEILKNNKGNNLCSIILNEQKHILLDISRGIISLTTDNRIQVLSEVFRKWGTLMMTFGTFGFMKLALLQTKSDSYNEHIMQHVMLPLKHYNFIIKTTHNVDTYAAEYINKIFTEDVGFFDETVKYEIKDLDDNIIFKNTIANIQNIVEPWNRKIRELIIDPLRKTLIANLNEDKTKLNDGIHPSSLNVPISFYDGIPLSSQEKINEFTVLISDLIKNEQVAIFGDPFTYIKIKKNRYLSLIKSEVIIDILQKSNSENIILWYTERQYNVLNDKVKIVYFNYLGPTVNYDFQLNYVPSANLNNSISSWVRDDDEIIPEILYRLQQTLNIFRVLKATLERKEKEYEPFYVFHGAREVIPTETKDGKNEFTTWSFLSTTFDFKVAQHYASQTDLEIEKLESGHIYVFKIENLPYVKLELLSQLVFPIGVEFVEEKTAFLNITDNKTLGNHTLHWYTNKEYTFNLDDLDTALSKPSIYPKTDFIKLNHDHIIQQDTVLQAAKMGSSIIYIDTINKTYNKNPVKIAIHEPFNQSFKRCLNEMLAAYTFSELFGLQTLDFKLMYSVSHKLLLLQSQINEQIPDAEKIASTNDGETKLKAAMANEFLIDCIMSNWDAYVNGNCLIIADKLFRVDVGGCLKYRARGEDRFTFANNSVPTDHDTIIQHSGMNISESNINANMGKLNIAKSKFDEFKIKAIVKMDEIINMMNMDESLFETYINYVTDIIETLRYRLEYYITYGNQILSQIISKQEKQKGGTDNILMDTQFTASIQISTQVVNEKSFFGSMADLNLKIANKLANKPEIPPVQDGGSLHEMSRNVSSDFYNINDYIKKHRTQPWLAYSS